MNKLIIGIDPDVTKSGVAILRPGKGIELTTLSFFELRDFLTSEKGNIYIVKVEAGHKVTIANFHGSKNSRTAAAIGRNVGANNEVGKKIVEMCEHYGLPVKEVKPFKKVWNGTKRKISHRELQLQFKIRGIPLPTKRTNQEERDAALICLIG